MSGQILFVGAVFTYAFVMFMTIMLEDTRPPIRRHTKQHHHRHRSR
jgi:hypothetical protein